MTVLFPPDMIPFWEAEGIAKAADELRQKHFGPTIPVDVDLIAERAFGLDLVPVNDLKRQVNADAFLSGDLKSICYDPAQPNIRIRFSIAHELGHRVLHANVIERLRTGSFDAWQEMLEEMPGSIWGRAEWQARTFGAQLLVPRAALIQHISLLRSKIQAALELVPNITPQELYEYLAPRISRTFDVSDAVLKARLSEEKIDIFTLS